MLYVSSAVVIEWFGSFEVFTVSAHAGPSTCKKLTNIAYAIILVAVWATQSTTWYALTCRWCFVIPLWLLKSLQSWHVVNERFNKLQKSKSVNSSWHYFHFTWSNWFILLKIDIYSGMETKHELADSCNLCSGWADSNDEVHCWQPAHTHNCRFDHFSDVMSKAYTKVSGLQPWYLNTAKPNIDDITGDTENE